MGDDLPDLPLLKRVGFSAAPGNAVESVKNAVHYVTREKGGNGAVRETGGPLMLKTSGKWEEPSSKNWIKREPCPRVKEREKSRIFPVATILIVSALSATRMSRLWPRRQLGPGCLPPPRINSEFSC